MAETSFLQGVAVDLRPLSSSDINDTYINWLNDAEVCTYNSHHVVPYTRELAEEYVKRVRSQKSDVVLAIIAKDSGAHIGNIALQQVNPVDRSAEYAILIGNKKYWSKGVGKEASSLILKHGFDALNLHRVYCGTSAENIPMQKLAAALGFKEEGRRREAMFKHGRFIDVIEYGLLRGEFKDA